MAKWDSLRKAGRNKALYDYKNSHPNTGWEEVGRQFGVSRQRAAKIYREEARRIASAGPTRKG